MNESIRQVAENTGVTFKGSADWSAFGLETMLFFDDPLTGTTFPIREDELSEEAVLEILYESRSKEWQETEQLRRLGYTNEQIARMKPAEAREKLAEAR